MIARFAVALWEFVAGDDWTSAAGVLAAIALTAILAGAGVPAWWIMPVSTVALLVLSVRRALARSSRAAVESGS